MPLSAPFSTTRHVKGFLLILTVWLNVGKAVWNRFFSIFLLEKGFSVSQVGNIKATSLAIKAVCQILIPLFQDLEPSALVFGTQDCRAYVSPIVATLGMIPLYFLAYYYSAPHFLAQAMVIKMATSVCSAAVGLADGIISQLVQAHGLNYSRLQLCFSITWSASILLGGLLIERFGFLSMFGIASFSNLECRRQKVEGDNASHDRAFA
ncbi:hypothetical protein T484DRAFT_2808706 [Baffinella frigidus]|nr:hypothetical protein T484DRAFT_2808706 [Cryptophyta sp. CCMP2293]|mmetsp:Transcript_51571/g.122821  ORF Transcript_51571/g.122821 Transcript_51571/m.122821 type:complete len:208 (-) Transcript_51571:1070-1693(-)